jgi:hypothetical protein
MTGNCMEVFRSALSGASEEFSSAIEADNRRT